MGSPELEVRFDSKAKNYRQGVYLRDRRGMRVAESP